MNPPVQPQLACVTSMLDLLLTPHRLRTFIKPLYAHVYTIRINKSTCNPYVCLLEQKNSLSKS
jgi:hypothetical protein